MALTERQPLLKEIFEPPIIAYRRGRSLKDELVRAKLLNIKANTCAME